MKKALQRWLQSLFKMLQQIVQTGCLFCEIDIKYILTDKGYCTTIYSSIY